MTTQPIILVLVFLFSFFGFFAVMFRRLVPSYALFAIALGSACFIVPTVSVSLPSVATMFVTESVATIRLGEVLRWAISGVLLGSVSASVGYGFLLFLSWLQRLAFPSGSAKGLFDREFRTEPASLPQGITLGAVAIFFSGPFPQAVTELLARAIGAEARGRSIPMTTELLASVGVDAFLLAIFLLLPFLIALSCWEIAAIISNRYFEDGLSSGVISAFRTVVVFGVLWLSLGAFQTELSHRASENVLRISKQFVSRG